jgi:hypothetical protein
MKQAACHLSSLLFFLTAPGEVSFDCCFFVFTQIDKFGYLDVLYQYQVAVRRKPENPYFALCDLGIYVLPMYLITICNSPP